MVEPAAPPRPRRCAPLLRPAATLARRRAAVQPCRTAGTVRLRLPARRPSRHSPGPAAPTSTALLLGASAPPCHCTGSWPPTPPHLKNPPARRRSPKPFRLDFPLEPLSYGASVRFGVGARKGNRSTFEGGQGCGVTPLRRGERGTQTAERVRRRVRRETVRKEFPT